MEDYSWKISGMDIVVKELKSIDLGVIMDTDNIPSKTIQALAGDNPVQQLSLVHEGDFNFTAALTVNLGKEHAGQYGNLYYHDREGKLVFIDAGQVSPSGDVSLTFSHASDYMIVMSRQKMSQADVPKEFAPAEKPNGSQKPTGGSGQKPSGSSNQNLSGNGSQNKNGESGKIQLENVGQNGQDEVQNQMEASVQEQKSSNNQNKAQNQSVQTGDETELMSLFLTSILSLGVVVYMMKKKKA